MVVLFGVRYDAAKNFGNGTVAGLGVCKNVKENNIAFGNNRTSSHIV